MAFVDSHGELNIEGSFDPRSQAFSVTLQGMPITKVEVGAFVIDRQVESDALYDVVVVHVPAVTTRNSRSLDLVSGRGYANATEHRFDSKFELGAGAFKQTRARNTAFQIEIPWNQ